MVKVWKWLQRRWFAPIDLKNPVRQYPFVPGLPLWECNLAMGEIVEAEFEMIPAIDKKGFGCMNRKLVMKDNCLYEFAINGANAVRKFEKRIVEHYGNGRLN